MQIVISHHLGREQFRFPKSRKRRIRSKWFKRDENWRYKEQIFQIGDTLYCDPASAERIRREFKTLSRDLPSA